MIPLLKEVMGKRPQDSYKFICDWIDNEGKKIQEKQEAKSDWCIIKLLRIMIILIQIF